MKTCKYIVLLLCLGALLGGCAKESVVLLADPGGHVGTIVVAPRADATQARVIDKEGYAAQVAASGQVSEAKKLDPAQIEKIYGKALAAQPEPPVLFLLYFHFGTSQLTSESQELLPGIVEVIQTRKSTDVGVVGHTDTMGAPQVNYRLSLERAKGVARILEDMGADPAIVTVDSHGETDLLVPTKDEVSEPRNRRVEVTVR